MWVILLEAGVALTLLLLIVWSTWPRQRGKRDVTADKEKSKHE